MAAMHPGRWQIEVTEEGKITPKEITVTIRNKTKTYDGQGTHCDIRQGR